MSMNLKAVTSCIGYQQITSLSSAASLTVPTTDKNGSFQKPTFALIICETQNVRWRDDGTAPTASVGMPLIPRDAVVSWYSFAIRRRFGQNSIY